MNNVSVLKEKWKDRLDEPGAFREFNSDWCNDDACNLTIWARQYDRMSINEVNEILKELGYKNKQMLQAIHYHIGCLLPYSMRLEWTKIIALDSGVSCKMLQEDTTLTAEQVEILDPSAKNAVYLYNINKEELLKNINKEYNVESEVIQGILNRDLGNTNG